MATVQGWRVCLKRRRRPSASLRQPWAGSGGWTRPTLFRPVSRLAPCYSCARETHRRSPSPFGGASLLSRRPQSPGHPVPSRQETLDRMIHKLTRRFSALTSLWRDFGVTGVALKNRHEQAEDHVDRLLQEMFFAEEAMRQRMVATIKHFRAEIVELSEHLGILATLPEPDLTVLQQQNAVHAKAAELNLLKSQRKKEFRRLRAEEAKLTAKLGAAPFVLPPPTPVPSQDVLQQLSRHIAQLTEEKLRQQVAKCEVLKQERMKEFITRAQDDLLSWFRLCCVPEREALLEEEWDSEDWSEERLEKLEKELQTLKDFHTKNEDIVRKVERREVLWARFLDYEKRLADPVRLNNRGPRLLSEMKERKRLETELPRRGLRKPIDKQLMSSPLLLPSTPHAAPHAAKAAAACTNGTNDTLVPAANGEVVTLAGN